MDASEKLRILGENIKTLRECRSLTQERLALMTNVNRSYLSEMENGQVNPSVVKLARIAEALEVPIAQLFQRM